MLHIYRAQRSSAQHAFAPLLLGAVVTAAALPMVLLGTIAPLLEDTFNVGDVAIGIAVTTAFACAAAVGAVAGLVADRDGGRAIMSGACAVLALGMLVAGSFVRTWGQLLLAMAICGCANGAILPIGYRWVWDHISQHRRGAAFGVMQAGFPAAALLAGVAAPYLSTRWGWHAPFAASGLLMLGLLGFLIAMERASSHDGAQGGTGSRAAPRVPAESRPDRQARRLLGLFVAISFLANSATSALGAYFVVSAVHTGDRASFAALLYGVGGGSCIVARVGLGIIGDRAPGRVVPALRTMLSCGAVGMVLLGTQIPSLLVVAAVLGLGIGWGWLGLMSLAVTRTFARIPGRAAGLVLTVGGSAGAAFGPALFGFAADSMGYRLAWILAAGLIAISALLLPSEEAGRRVIR